MNNERNIKKAIKDGINERIVGCMKRCGGVWCDSTARAYLLALDSDSLTDEIHSSLTRQFSVQAKRHRPKKRVAKKVSTK